MKTKLYSQWRQEKPNWYTDNQIDPIISTLCDEWFNFRRLCDRDEKFEYFFLRDLNLLTPQFKANLALENLYLTDKIDWFVNNYAEHWNYSKNQQKGSNTQILGSGNTTEVKNTGKNQQIRKGQDLNTYGENIDEHEQGSNSGTQANKQTNNTNQKVSNTGTQNITNKGDSSGNSSSTTTGEETSNTTGNNSQNNDNRHIESVLPNSISSYAGSFDSQFGGVDESIGTPWAVASAKSQDKGTSSGTASEDTHSNTSSTTEANNSSASNNTSLREDDLSSNTSNTGTIDNLRTDNLSNERERDLKRFGNNDKNYNENTDDIIDTMSTTKSNNTGQNTNNIDSVQEITNLDINTGRQSLPPSSVINEAIRTIRQSNAWAWMSRALENNFWLLFEDEEG